MRVLLDEMLPRKLKRLLPEGAEVVTVQERGWDSKKNGELLVSAEKEFDLLLTTDRGIPHQPRAWTSVRASHAITRKTEKW